MYDYEPFKKSFLGRSVIPADVAHVNTQKIENYTVKSLFKRSNATQVLSNYFSNLSSDKILNSYVKKLTNGEKNAVNLSLGIEADPRVLIIDDYALFFDNKMENKFRKKLISINKDHGTTIILGSPNEQLLRSFCSVLIYLDNGHISKIRTGTYKPNRSTRQRSYGNKKNNTNKSKSRFRGKNDKPR